MSAGVAVFIGVLAGLAAGGGIAWSVLSRRLAQADAARASMGQRVTELTSERNAARTEASQHRDVNADLQAELASAKADRDARVEEMSKKQAEIEEQFKGIAAKVSESTRSAFIEEFRDLTSEQTASAGKTFNELVEPVRERLRELQDYVGKADTARATDTAKVSQSVEQLVSETSGLRQILRDSKMRGAWGEQHLRNVIEAAGMSSHIDYVEQGTVGEVGAEGHRRPDVVVKVPGGASVVIDAKTPFAAYDRAMRTSDEAEQRKALAEHAAALSERAKELGDRDYGRWVSGSPDFVLMYVPTDPMLDVAMDVDSDVWQNAWQRHRVLIATPGLLIAFLRTVALAWQRQDIARNAEEVAKLGNDLYSRLSTYLKHIDKMRRGLRTAVDAYNDGVGSFERMVLPQARRFRELGSVSSNDQLNEPNMIELDVRTVNAPELDSGDS